jgi:hypothetical protein
MVDSNTLLCISDNMFVHNNSKHGRKIRRLDGTEGIENPQQLLPNSDHNNLYCISDCSNFYHR